MAIFMAKYYELSTKLTMPKAVFGFYSGQEQIVNKSLGHKKGLNTKIQGQFPSQ
ncbi:MAG: hypothetical protein ACD_57C00014G0004 [uncultured bacterium]|nr:MAG: hypothetical protein ACD_57C00014G0004 [uncultured bacterium]